MIFIIVISIKIKIAPSMRDNSKTQTGFGIFCHLETYQHRSSFLYSLFLHISLKKNKQTQTDQGFLQSFKISMNKLLYMIGMCVLRVFDQRLRRKE